MNKGPDHSVQPAQFECAPNATLFTLEGTTFDQGPYGSGQKQCIKEVGAFRASALDWGQGEEITGMAPQGHHYINRDVNLTHGIFLWYDLTLCNAQQQWGKVNRMYMNSV